MTLGNIVFGGKGNGGSSTASAYVVPDGMRFQNSTFETFPSEGLDFSQKTNFSYCWNSCSSLTEFPQLDLSSGTNFGGAWTNCKALTNIGGFGAIKQSFSLSSSPKLTVESLMNVINQAAVVTGKTMTLGSDNLAKLSDEQKAVATNKGWTLA